MMTKLGVVGLGTMGVGIAEVFARGGFDVIAVDGSEELAKRGRGFVEKSLDGAVKRGKLSASEKDDALARMTFSADLASLKDADLVIEAVPEKLSIKTSIFTALDDIVSESCILATNTSSLSVTEIAAATKHPGRVIGMHFFNPAPVLALVEVIHGVLGDAHAVDEVEALATALGKKPVVVGDKPGFVANALLISYLARTIRAYENGLASREDMDAAIHIGIGLPMGPLTLSDLIGLDVVLEVCEVLFGATRDPSVTPPSILRQLVAAGRLGRKTGAGFYTYENGKVSDAVMAVASEFVGSVGVVGTGELVDDLAASMTASGLDIIRVAAAGEAPKLADVALVFAVEQAQGGCGEGCACSAGEGNGLQITDMPLMQAVRDAVSPTTPIAALGEVTVDAVLTGDRANDARVVPIVLFEPTKGGQLLEIARPLGVSDDAINAIRSFAQAAGWTPVVSKNRTGFIVDGLLYPHLNDAVAMVDSGYATMADVDTAMKAGCGYPKGPFELLAEAGEEQVAATLAAMYAEQGATYLVPSPMLVEHVMAGIPLNDVTDASA